MRTRYLGRQKTTGQSPGVNRIRDRAYHPVYKLPSFPICPICACGLGLGFFLEGGVFRWFCFATRERVRKRIASDQLLIARQTTTPLKKTLHAESRQHFACRTQNTEQKRILTDWSLKATQLSCKLAQSLALRCCMISTRSSSGRVNILDVWGEKKDICF